MAEAFSSQHTNTFPDFLAQAGISLLVSTYQAGKLITLRHQDGVLNTHFVDMPKPMGIALQEPHLAIGTGYQLAHYFNMPDVGTRLEPANAHNACYVPRETHITGDIDIHEMGFTDEGELWLVNTKMSCLCTISQEYSIVPRWRPPFISSFDLTDRCHLNGLAMKNGKPTYVSALGTTNTAAGWRETKANGGMLMDIQTNQMIAYGLSMPHSPRWYQDKLWVLESGAGSLATVDLETGKLTTIVELPGFTRGLDFIGRYAVVGLSEVRETAVFAGLPLTERCKERQCGVYIVDIIEKQVVGFVVFSGEVQEIFSVQIVPSSFPAVLSMDDPILRSTYSIPDESLKDFSAPSPDQTLLEKANLLYSQGNFDEAIKAYLNLLEEFPNLTNARLHLGMAYLDSTQWKNAIETLEQVVSKEANHADAHNALGRAWAGLNHWKNAKTSYEQAISIDLQYAAAHHNRALVLLTEGQYKEAWDELEWRWKIPGNQPFDCAQPMWTSNQAISNLGDKTVLVHTEQNDGDSIQFARFLPLLAKACKKLIVLCPEPLRLFFKGIDGVDEVRLSGQTPHDSFDVFIPIMSLPGILEITLKSVPTNTPYFQSPTEVVVPTLKTDKRLKVGLVWKSDPLVNQSQNHCTLDNILHLTTLNDVEFYSLQTPLSPAELKQLDENNIENLEQELVSYTHAGAIIEQLDLLICVESTVAHLSGSLGKTTWMLEGENYNWNWIENDGKSLWYPEIQIFKKQANGSCEDVVTQIQLALSAKLQ